MLTDRKPSWLDKKIKLSDCAGVKAGLRELGVNTVCEEASCPNIGECFERGEATFIILGKVCTRACAFCGIAKGEPKPPDPDEPKRVAEGVKKMGLKHVVITSVTRDDLPDGGAAVFAATIEEIRKSGRPVVVEALVPDFRMDRGAIAKVAAASPDIIAHNLETVPRLYKKARQGADYKRSLEVLKTIKEIGGGIFTKSGLMLGLGETEQEVLSVFDDLVSCGCDFLSIGQYLAPSYAHVPVEEYITPEKFTFYRQKALDAGLKKVLSGPYVRSSYMAGEYIGRSLTSPGKLSFEARR